MAGAYVPVSARHAEFRTAPKQLDACPGTPSNRCAKDNLVIGLRFNNYELVSVLGQGGMGTVYLARHTYTGRKAAVKLLHPHLALDQTLVIRFMNEARATAAIGHANIIDIIDVGMLPDGHAPYLMMEFLQGESLAKRLQRNRPLPIREAIEIACQTASALSAAHACDIVHRDLKPDNLFLVPDAAILPMRLRVKVLDFGIAKLMGDLSDGSVNTRTGAIMGTPQYMSPEQCRGIAREIDHRTDIYALGVILYEMVCGAPPFVSEGGGDILIMHVHNPPDPPRTRNADIPEAMEAVILRALAKNPDQRFASMIDFREALRPTDVQSAATVGMGGHAQLALAPTIDATSPLAAAKQAAALDPIEQAASGDGDASWAKAPSTTLTSTTGQILAAAMGKARRRRTILAGGVLLAAALAILATVLHKGPQTPNAASIAPAALALPLPSSAPAAPTAGESDAGPPPAAEESPVVTADESRAPKDKRRDKKDGKKVAAVAAPTPPALPAASTPPAPPPSSSPAIKPGERW